MATSSSLLRRAGAPAWDDPTRLPVDVTLAPLLPNGLPCGVVAGIVGGAASSFLLALLAGPLRCGSWAAVAGAPALGLEAAGELGIPLERLVIVPQPGPSWLEVAAGLIDACEITAIVPPSRCPPGAARRLAVRARERRSLLVVFWPVWSRPGQEWPEVLDLRFSVAVRSWTGLGHGYGALRSREVEVVLSGRRTAGRDRRATVMLPALPDGDRPIAALYGTRSAETPTG